MEKNILLGHGSGGQLSHELIRKLFFHHFSNNILDSESDSAVLEMNDCHLSFTTDSFVVDPVFFPGGDIGKLAVAGTVNDLAVSGARPLYLSSAFIIEEGFPVSDLEKIVASMADEAKVAGVQIVTGDTKVVDRGKCDKIFINTSGVGLLQSKYSHIGTGARIAPGDKIILSGTLADHGMCIMAAREHLQFMTAVHSDCACLNHMIREVLDSGADVKFMRDPTRGGAATVLCELAEKNRFGIEIFEEKIPVKEEVRGICEMLGFDPMYVANEGKVLMVVADASAENVLQVLRKNESGKEASIIGEVTEEHRGKAWMTTSIGGRRIIDMLAGAQLPRIC